MECANGKPARLVVSEIKTKQPALYVDEKVQAAFLGDFSLYRKKMKAILKLNAKIPLSKHNRIFLMMTTHTTPFNRTILTILLFGGLLSSHVAHANDNPTELKQPADSAQQKSWLNQLNQQAKQPAPQSGSANTSPNHVTDADLIKQPALLAQLLQQALNTPETELIQSLANAYRQTENPDALLLARADGTVLRGQNRLSDAIAAYERIVQTHNDTRTRLDLAAMQFENKQWRDADQQFESAKQNEALPDAVLHNVARYQNAIAQQQAWQFEAGISPIRNQNVNDAPEKPYCLYGIYCSTTRPIKATGIGYSFDFAKQYSLRGNHSLVLRGQASGTHYINHAQYNDAFLRVLAGWQWQDKTRTIGVLPFYQAQFSGSDNFDSKPTQSGRVLPYMLAHGNGLQLNYAQQYGTRWQSYHSLEGYRTFYRETARAQKQDGWTYSTYHSLAFRATSNMTWFTGYQYSRFAPKNRDLAGSRNNAAFQRHAISLGWLQRWQTLGGLNSRVVYSYAKRRYSGIATLSNEAQRNHETSLQLALSHDKLQYRGLQPSLNVQFNRIRSNRPWAQRKSHTVYLGLDKSF
ncbi:surface lipoprotein assembly modifier [Kingella kingae]|uniref:surface lipoprotein assembly modifier n=2 Tax=Kingella kingae TaxID=504 RepID=UPI001E592DF2|nr:surface lipoprotein assembly modifier [Kingella kingae]